MYWNSVMDLYLASLLTFILIGCALQDAIRQKIPNLLTLPAILFGLLYHGITGGLQGLIFSLSGFALGFGFFLILYVMGGMGAGDVKLMGAVGAVLGPKGTFIAVLYTGVAGGILMVLLLAIHRAYGRDLFSRLVLFFNGLVFTRQLVLVPAADNIYRPKVCYGIAIAAGTLVSVWMEYFVGYTLI